MKKKSFIFILLIPIFTLLSGCIATHTAVMKDRTNVYSAMIKETGSKVVLVDLEDTRTDKKLVGRVCGLNLKTKKPINSLLTDAIATKLGEEGYNVQKTKISDRNSKVEIAELLKNAWGNILLTGTMSKFYISSFDAVLDRAKGEALFEIKIFDAMGNVIFDERFLAHSENWIGLTGQFGAKKSIELTIDAAVQELFEDKAFTDTLKKLNQTS